MRLASAAWIVALGLLGLAPSFADPVSATEGKPQEKVELRTRFQKGEKFPLKLSYAMSFKLDKVPEAFQGVVTEEPLNLKVEALLDVEVKSVADDGAATLEGAWKQLKAKGHALTQDVDFLYDAAKKDDEKPKVDEGGGQGLLNLEDQLRKIVKNPVAMSVDRLGKMKVEGGAGKGELNGMLSLNGLMGSLPADKVGPGDKWTTEDKLAMPGPLAGAVQFKVKSENSYASDEKGCAVIQSKFSVSSEKGAPGENLLDIELKTSGEGEGKTHFRVKDGRPAKSESKLKVRLEAAFNAGGQDIDLKASVKIDQGVEIP